MTNDPEELKDIIAELEDDMGEIRYTLRQISQARGFNGPRGVRFTNPASAVDSVQDLHHYIATTLVLAEPRAYCCPDCDGDYPCSGPC
jgi:hypothetical protein